jgi:hypothetical protein
MILGTNRDISSTIIPVLADAGEMSLADLHYAISCSIGQRSIQAVRKSVKNLKRQGIVMQNRDMCSLNANWCIAIVSLANRLTDVGLSDTNLCRGLPVGGHAKVYKANDLVTLYNRFSHLFMSGLRTTGVEIAYSWNPHAWFYLLDQDPANSQFEGAAPQRWSLQNMGLINARMKKILGGNTYLDKWTARNWNRNNVELVFDSTEFSDYSNTMFNVIGEYVTILSMDENSTNVINAIYSSVKSEEELQAKRFYIREQLRELKIDAQISVKKDAKLAAKLKARFDLVLSVKATTIENAPPLKLEADNAKLLVSKLQPTVAI